MYFSLKSFELAGTLLYVLQEFVNRSLVLECLFQRKILSQYRDLYLKRKALFTL